MKNYCTGGRVCGLIRIEKSDTGNREVISPEMDKCLRFQTTHVRKAYCCLTRQYVTQVRLKNE